MRNEGYRYLSQRFDQNGTIDRALGSLEYMYGNHVEDCFVLLSYYGISLLKMNPV